MKTDIKIDFLRYALHELMLPHQCRTNQELIWRCNRVVQHAQVILNNYGLPQDYPTELTLLRDEAYFKLAKDEIEYSFIQRLVMRIFKIKTTV